MDPHKEPTIRTWGCSGTFCGFGHGGSGPRALAPNVLPFAAVSVLSRVFETVGRHRRRIALGVVVVGVLVVGGQLLGAFPRDTEIRYRLGPDHSEVDALSLLYRSEGELTAGATFRWPEGAPGSLTHTVELAPGRYEIQANLSGEGSPRVVRRILQVPVDGAVRIDLFDEALAEFALPAGPGRSGGEP